MGPLAGKPGRIATLLGGPVAVLVAALIASNPAGAATQRDWVYTQRMELNGHSATYCYDRLSLRKEATVIRVLVKSSVANRVLADGCQDLAGGADGVTFESEILIRCRDKTWAQTVDSRGHRVPEPLPEGQWRSARAGEHHNMVDQICAFSARTKEAGRMAPADAQRRGGQSKARPSSGTGFFVDEAGHVLTNRHVVESCRNITVVVAGKRWPAEVVAHDSTLDLALLKTAAATTAFATFRAAAPPRAGETVIAAGFPLRVLLASEPIVSTGIVNATAGIRDDTTRFQISAPVQPGNSGGPLLDASGNVIGVVVSKLDAIKLAQTTGDMPQNVNFAVKGEFARAFLEKNSISPRTGAWTRPMDSVGVAVIAKSITVPVDCR